MQTSIRKWREADGDNTFALNWDLDENSHVWEIGGFEGRWAQQIWDKFHCYITIFEPQLWAVEKMKNRFAGIDKIDIRPYGLWLADGKYQMGNYHTDGASLVKNDGREATIPVSMKNYYPEIFFYNHLKIGLALMNIEGAEYTLLPFIIESGAINKFNNFWCQFHPEYPDDNRHKTIYEDMEESGFEKIWDFFPTAVAWKRIET